MPPSNTPNLWLIIMAATLTLTLKILIEVVDRCKKR